MSEPIYVCPRCPWHGIKTDAVPGTDRRLYCPDCGEVVEQAPPNPPDEEEGK